MPTVVIIHAADDALPARALGEKLRLANLTPVIEKAAGDERQTAVKNAALSVALWSPRSVADSGVAADVAFARSKGKLVHACMQSVQPPAEFRSEQWVDLTGWRGEDDFAAWRQLAGIVTEKAGVAPLPPPPPRPPSGFFQPGRVEAAAHQAQPVGASQQGAPRQSAPAPRAAKPQRAAAPPPPPRAPIRDEPAESRGGPNMAVIAIVTFLVVALAGGGGYYFWSQSQGGASAEAWAQIDQSDPDALRAFISGNPGQFRDEAEDALAALEQTSFEAARNADTIEALEAYVADFPQGANNLAARGRIAELRAQPAAPAEAAPGEPLAPEALNPTAPVDPDLVPPGSTGGPAPLEPLPQPEPEPPTQDPAPPPGE
jgi:flagellar basal body-associated protein FliL